MFHGVEEASFRVLVLGNQLLVARFLAECNCLFMQKAGGVGLLEEEEARKLDQHIGKGGSPECPAPTSLFGNEATSDGPNSCCGDQNI